MRASVAIEPSGVEQKEGRMRRLPALGTLIIWISLGASCSSPSREPTTATPEAPFPQERVPLVASADLDPTEGQQVKGAIIFQELSEGVRVVAHIRGLDPRPHGLSIHGTGDCRAAAAPSDNGNSSSADPEQRQSQEMEYARVDLGNLVADEDGYAQLDLTFDSLSLGKGPNSIIGRAVIVHANTGNATTSSTGNSLSRLACGIVTAHPVASEPREGSGF